MNAKDVWDILVKGAEIYSCPESGCDVSVKLSGLSEEGDEELIRRTRDHSQH